MKIIIMVFILALVTSACAASTAQPGGGESEAGLPALPDYGPAPELAGETWLNVDGPIQPEDLRGQVVLIDMWTFG